jgi:hypothetical protein
MEGVTESYAGVMGDFCELNFTAQKNDPTSVPMFRHLVQKSPTCKELRYRVNMKDFVELARKHDAKSDSESKAMPLGGVIFHESRCGSTLIANALQAMSPQQHRVYSEAQPEMAANLCGDSFQYCSKQQAAELLKDVIYAMSRTSDADEERLFIKFHSDNSRNLQVFQHAFPDTPWLFVFRNPAHVIVSQFKEGKSIAKCVRGMKDPSPQIVEILSSKGHVASTASRELFCAATLASYCESALKSKERAPQLGTFVHYPDLPYILTEDIFPNKFGLVLSEEQTERVQSVCSMYSKASHGRARPYEDDSIAKERKVTPAIQQAANIFLQDSYQKLLRQRGPLAVKASPPGGAASNEL